jgi:pyruvate/oxaloacetate carboxyltransferase
MDTPTSSVFFPEIYLQYMENTKIVDVLLQHNVIGYFRYVDDILIYTIQTKQIAVRIHDVLNSFNNTMPTVNFNTEEEVGNKINFLDITISKENNNISFDIQYIANLPQRIPQSQTILVTP